MVEGAVRPCCLPEYADALRGPLRRIHTWRAPPNWSVRDWREEMEAHCAAAMVQAAHDYDPVLGVPLDAFIRLRVLHSALTRYRREWAFALRCAPEADDETRRSAASGFPGCATVEALLPDALARLPESSRLLIEQLFWKQRTEADIARQLGISQSAICKRKKALLNELRCWLNTPERI
jgi:DNA-directed RNA polymerase specialized sigma24 family protein